MSVSYDEDAWIDPSSGRRLAYRLWRPPSSSALLIVIHGFGEHGGRYHSFAQSLAERGICVAAPDLWGHGRSDGQRGDLEDISRCVQDLSRLADQALLPASGYSHYALFGHSFGGLVAIHWAIEHPVSLRRVVVQSPLLEAGFPVPRWKTLSATVLAHCWPTCTFPMNLDLPSLSHDPAVARAYRADPLVHNAMTARAYRAIMRARDTAFERAPMLNIPVLLLYGTADQIISIPMAQRWFDRLTCERRIVSFTDAFHELHHEPVSDQIVALVADWILDADRPR